MWEADPRGTRKHFTMGRLGWNTHDLTLEQNARDILKEIGFTGSPEELKAPFKYGSICNITLASDEVGNDVASKVQDLKKIFHGDKPVWIYESTTKEERNFSGLRNRLKECVTACKQDHTSIAFEFCDKSRKIYMNGSEMVKLNGNSLIYFNNLDTIPADIKTKLDAINL